ncbi:hypothetical protein, partial [Altererythrobacter sp.]|uniref:hypothetical protein n=1 Tax=Altererythrobacter sp. TaxID=1872480 RepID=UPI003D0BBA23
KYSAMITWLFLLLIAERARDDEDWTAFRSRNDDLFAGRPGQQAAQGGPGPRSLPHGPALRGTGRSVP